MVKIPNISIQYKQDEGILKPLRKVAFTETYSYSSQCLKLLHYLTLLSRILNLEYLMGRNNSPGLDVLEMEDQVLSGRLYWEKDKELGFSSKASAGAADLGTSDRVINKIVNQRRARIDLAEDLN